MLVGDFELKRLHSYVNLVAEFIKSVKRTGCIRRKVRYVVTVVRERISWVDCRCFPHDFLSFHDGGRAVAVGEYPLAAQESYGAVS